jgi:hypothetical protein
MEEPLLPMAGAAMTEPAPVLFATNEVINLVGHQAPGGIAEEVVASSMVVEHVGYPTFGHEHVGYPTFGQEDGQAIMVATVVDNKTEVAEAKIGETKALKLE